MSKLSDDRLREMARSTSACVYSGDTADMQAMAVELLRLREEAVRDEERWKKAQHARLVAEMKLSEASRIPAIGVGPADTAVIVEALECYNLCGIRPPRADIARIVAMLSSSGGGS